MIIRPKSRGFICINSHPLGCAANVEAQVAYARQHPLANDHSPKRVLVIGGSTGYGLASRVTSAFSAGAATIGVFFGRAPDTDRPAMAGWYNSAAFERAPKREGIYAKSVNADAFADETKARVLDLIQRDLGQVDLIVYSLASPKRVHPRTGEAARSVLKPLGKPFHAKTIDLDGARVTDVTLEPATEAEISETVAVMGGEDWQMWLDALETGNALAEGVTTVAYSYIGPKQTWPIYRSGTIGAAKNDLEATAKRLSALLGKARRGRAFVSVNKALVTQASAAIPVVPLYISLLYKTMKERDTHEGCIEQIVRLFAEQLYRADSSRPELDDAGRIRLDDLEMAPEVQAAVAELWPQVTTENLSDLTDFAGYRQEFLSLFGFGVGGVDYEIDVDLAKELTEATFSDPV
jgi:enoyl-[acyl-carrier protein] reductase / trans-2-enoyl-CoA reductase (NAD+)